MRKLLQPVITMSRRLAQLSDEDRATLLAVGRDSIAHGLDHNRSLAVKIVDYAAPLRVTCATFVTIKWDKNLRGCIGTIEARRPLIVDVAENAFAAAFQDPRFQSVPRHELDMLELHIALLSPPEPIQFSSEQDLERQLRSGVDGLIIEEGPCRGTFLPAVWESIPDPHDFIQALKRKAGLLETYWSKSVRVWRYATESIS